MTASMHLNGQVWMLRRPCGCVVGASMVNHTEPEAWAELHGGDPREPRPVGWTLTLEPAETAVPEVRTSLGDCEHG